MAVRNSAVDFKRKIKNLKYKKDYEVKYDPKDDIYKYKDGKVTLNTDDKLLMKDLKIFTNTRKNGDVYLNSNIDKTGQKINPNKNIKEGEKNFAQIGYNNPLLKKITDNQYLTSEQSSFLGYNTDLPNLLMDGRILPQKASRYVLNRSKDKEGDFVLFNEYDPIAVTPFDMLSEEQKKERVEKYGTDGVPKSYSNKKKNTQKQQIKVDKKPLSKIEPVNKLDPKGILVEDNELGADVKIIPSRRTPKSYKVTETQVNPYGLDDRKGSDNITTYEVSDIDNIDKRKINGKREIQAQYADGGLIEDPIKGKNLTTEQQSSAESDALWFNNWTSNRVVNGTKLNKGYQIQSNQVVQSGDLSAYGESGRYDPNTKEITLDPNVNEQGVAAHEYAHRYQDYTERTRPKTYNDYINKPITDIIQDNGTYDTNPNEIHSELVRLRRNSNFKPDQVINEDDLNNVDTSLYNLKDIDKESLIKLLNSTAYNNNSNINQNIAAYGGDMNNSSSSELITFDNGGTHQENRLGGIPMGRGANGKMNTVEEGETKYDFKDGGYVFSNRINTKGLFRDV